MRTDALLSQYGYCTRREAALWLKAGRITRADGTPIRRPAEHVQPEETLVDGKPVEFPRGLYIALHKPVGYTCSHREEGPLVYDLLPPRWLRRSKGINTVGRLDKETSGLLLITDDGQFLHALTAPGKKVDKTYCFTTAAPIPADAPQLFAAGGLMLNGEDTPCLPARLEPESACAGRITLHEGRYHQVRRMLAAVGAPVLTLHRLSVGPLCLDALHLSPGEWTPIDPALFA